MGGPISRARDPILFLAETKEQTTLAEPFSVGPRSSNRSETFDGLKNDDLHDVCTLGWRPRKGNCVPKSSQIQV